MARADIELKNEVIALLEKVQAPDSKASLMDALMVEDVEVKGGNVKVLLLFEDNHSKETRWDLEDSVCDQLEALEGVSDVSVSSVTRSGMSQAPAAPSHDHSHDHSHGHSHSHGQDHGHAQGGGGGGVPASKSLQGVGKVIAVASGKGGVGKSTVAVNLALALHAQGHRVGLLDIDVYGPSLPTLLGVKGRPTVKERRIVPLEAKGLKVMSLGFLMDDDTPVIWRGPIVTGIIRQFLQDVEWAGLDYLIIDLPPGTGDAQLSLAQSVPLDGAIVVTTPSDLALVDAARGLQMFKTLKVDVIGIVENMSHYVWPGVKKVKEAIDLLDQSGGSQQVRELLEKTLQDHEKVYVFGKNGGRKEAKRLGTPFLGEIPLDGKVRKGGDEGNPIVTLDPSSATSAAFLQLAKKIAELHPVTVDEEGQPKKRKGLFSFLKG